MGRGGVIAGYQAGRTGLLEQYSTTCLRRIWWAQHFAWRMTMMLHRHDDDGDFAQKLQLPELKYACNSAAAATTLAENYVGLEAI